MRKTILVLVAMALLSGCATNGQFDGKKTALLIGTVFVVGMIAANSSEDTPVEIKPKCYTNSDGFTFCQ